MNNKYLHILLLTSALVYPIISIGEIYRYQDANGNWRFSDTPPDGVNPVSPTSSPEKKRNNASFNIQSDLESRFNPQTVIERATLAVVKVQTAMGSGSGFFVTDSGYLVTNVHVVRPSQNQVNETQSNLEKQSNWLARRQSVINSRKNYLERERGDLQEHKDYIDGLSASERTRELSEYRSRKRDYQSYKKDTNKLSIEYKKNLGEYQSAKRAFDTQRASASIAQQFSVILKNDRKLNASLVRLSDKHDLALLKVEGFTMPFLELANNHSARQTDRVFAIGSPLGNKDHITSGIVTSLRKSKIFMDAQILPGNSGGPLIDRKGSVIGVNTWKHYAQEGSIAEGFGIAISVDVVKKEFANFLADTGQSSNSSPNDKGDVDLLDSIMNEYQRNEE